MVGKHKNSCKDGKVRREFCFRIKMKGIEMKLIFILLSNEIFIIHRKSIEFKSTSLIEENGCTIQEGIPLFK